MAIVNYDANETYFGSDHRPVFAHLTMVTQP